MTRPLLLLALAFAPAPAPKPPAPLSPVGEWMLEWQGGEGPATFSPGGGFACVWAGTLWIGTWTLEGGVLSVDEHIPARDEWTRSSQQLKWAATLEKGKLEGPLSPGGGLFRLRKPAPAAPRTKR